VHLLSVPFKEPQPKVFLQLCQPVDSPVLLNLAEPDPCGFGVRQVIRSVSLDTQGMRFGQRAVFYRTCFGAPSAIPLSPAHLAIFSILFLVFREPSGWGRLGVAFARARCWCSRSAFCVGASL
jgi:hypothetical protein